MNGTSRHLNEDIYPCLGGKQSSGSSIVKYVSSSSTNPNSLEIPRTKTVPTGLHGNYSSVE